MIAYVITSLYCICNVLVRSAINLCPIEMDESTCHCHCAAVVVRISIR